MGDVVRLDEARARRARAHEAAFLHGTGEDRPLGILQVSHRSYTRARIDAITAARRFLVSRSAITPMQDGP